MIRTFRLSKGIPGCEGLDVTDSANHELWEALARAEDSAHPGGSTGSGTQPVDRISISARIVEVAEAAEVRNIREHGQNDGATVRMIQTHSGLVAGEPWCVAFAWAVVDLAYFLDQDHPPDIPGPAKRF